jgi:hypothetical protein
MPASPQAHTEEGDYRNKTMDERALIHGFVQLLVRHKQLLRTKYVRLIYVPKVINNIGYADWWTGRSKHAPDSRERPAFYGDELVLTA